MDPVVLRVLLRERAHPYGKTPEVNPSPSAGGLGVH